jgi:hypothetical protein
MPVNTTIVIIIIIIIIIIVIKYFSPFSSKFLMKLSLTQAVEAHRVVRC